MFPNWLQAILGNDLGGQHQGSAGGYGGLQPVQPYRPRPSSFRELPDDYRRDSKVSALLALAQAIGSAPPGQLGSGIAAGAAGVQQSRRADLERYQDRYDEQRSLDSTIRRREEVSENSRRQLEAYERSAKAQADLNRDKFDVDQRRATSLNDLLGAHAESGEDDPEFISSLAGLDTKQRAAKHQEYHASRMEVETKARAEEEELDRLYQAAQSEGYKGSRASLELQAKRGTAGWDEILGKGETQEPPTIHRAEREVIDGEMYERFVDDRGRPMPGNAGRWRVVTTGGVDPTDSMAKWARAQAEKAVSKDFSVAFNPEAREAAIQAGVDAVLKDHARAKGVAKALEKNKPTTGTTPPPEDLATPGVDMEIVREVAGRVPVGHIGNKRAAIEKYLRDRGGIRELDIQNYVNAIMGLLEKAERLNAGQ